MQYTENHNFKLPDGTDRFDIQNENNNWSLLDTLLEDYLPLTAGSTKPLSAPLYIENTYGKARFTIGSAGGVTLAARNEEDDTSTVGFHSFFSDNKGYAVVFGNGGEIRLRPNGITNTTGQVCIDNSGWLHAPYSNDSIEWAVSGTIKVTMSVRKIGNVIFGSCSGGTGTALSSFTSGTTSSSTLPSGYIPSTTIYITGGLARDNGAWASANYYPIVLTIGSDGHCSLIGNQTNIRTCKYIEISFCYPVQ